MKLFNHINQVKGISNAVVTMGTFDGVHLGHQAIFKEMVGLAREVGGSTLVVTFYPHPRQVLNIDSDNLRFICSQEDKIHRLAESGIENVVVLPFTKEFSCTPSEVFIKEFIIKKLHPVAVVVGYDHHFGKNRMGDYSLLQELGRQYQFKVVRVNALDIDGIAVSSTKIRNALALGNVKVANKLLGYVYSVTGTVVRGNEIGRTIGFPTANLDIPKELKMINNAGVYACRVNIDGKDYDAMANTGMRPTIGDRSKGDFIIEVNVFDFEGDLYGKPLTVRFYDRLRDEEKFESLSKLKAQLEQDRINAKRLLEKL